MIVYVAEYWDDEYGRPGGAIGVARTFKGALDILAGYEVKEFETKIISQKITPYGDGSNNKYVQFKEDDGFFSREYSIREMELKE